MNLKDVLIRVDEEKKDFEELQFSRRVTNYFMKRRSSVFSTMVTNQERAKNAYLCKHKFRAIKNKNFEKIVEGFEFPDNLDSDKEYEKMRNPEFWIGIIDFMFRYSEDKQLYYYTQTINGVFLYYFKHYGRTKSLIESKSLSGEERLILSSIRHWKNEDVINCFYCYIIRLYYKLNPLFRNIKKKEYYRYVIYTAEKDEIPRLTDVVLQNNHLIRGLLLSFEPAFKAWADSWEFDLATVFNYEDFKKLCEDKGVVFDDSVTDKDIDSIIESAMIKFVIL